MAREAEVLRLYTTMVGKLKDKLTSQVPRILEALFGPTLEMITNNFTEFPEHRINFFRFLQAVNKHCFVALFSIPPAEQKLVVQSIVWAFKHTDRDIAGTGLDILFDLLRNVSNSQAVAQRFYQAHLLALTQELLGVLTDRLHKASFAEHAKILRHVFQLVETGGVQAPLFSRGEFPHVASNQQFLRVFVSRLIAEHFPGNLSAADLKAYVESFFQCKDPTQFR